MTAHELARLLLAGPDVEVVALSDSSQSYDVEYKIEALEPRRLCWYMSPYSPYGEYLAKEGSDSIKRTPLSKPPVDVVVLKGGDCLDNRP